MVDNTSRVQQCLVYEQRARSLLRTATVSLCYRIRLRSYSAIKEPRRDFFLCVFVDHSNKIFYTKFFSAEAILFPVYIL